MVAATRTSAAGVQGALNMQQSAEALSQAFPPLLVMAERIANAVVHGMHGRRRAGPGEDFWQYRPYSPGDAAQRIDWRKSARSERVLIRETEWEATNTLWLWAASAPGMSYRSQMAVNSKAERAAVLALAVGLLATKAGERVAAIGSGHSPDHTRRAVRQMAEHFENALQGAGEELPAGVHLPRFSNCLLLGDFLSPLDDIADRLGALAANGVNGHIVQVLDPAEEAFPFEGRTEFAEFAGSNKLILGKAQSMRDAYRDRLAQHRAGLQEIARRLGWSFLLHHTDQPAQAGLMTIFGLIARDERMRTGPAGG